MDLVWSLNTEEEEYQAYLESKPDEIIESDEWNKKRIWGNYKDFVFNIRRALSKRERLGGYFWVLNGDGDFVIATIQYDEAEISFAISRSNAYIYSYAIRGTTYHFKDAPAYYFKFQDTGTVRLPFESQYMVLEKAYSESDPPVFSLLTIKQAVRNLFYNTDTGKTNIQKKAVFILLHTIPEAVRFNYFERAVALEEALEPKATVIRTSWAHLCQEIQDVYKKNPRGDIFETPCYLGLAYDGVAKSPVRVEVHSVNEAKDYISLIQWVEEKEPIKKTNKNLWTAKMKTPMDNAGQIRRRIQ